MQPRTVLPTPVRSSCPLGGVRSTSSPRSSRLCATGRRSRQRAKATHALDRNHIPGNSRGSRLGAALLLGHDYGTPSFHGAISETVLAATRQAANGYVGTALFTDVRTRQRPDGSRRGPVGPSLRGRTGSVHSKWVISSIRLGTSPATPADFIMRSRSRAKSSARDRNIGQRS